jgi:hypothetical protein
MQPEEAQRRNFGVFSARYGNVYTVAQAAQLFDRAYGHFEPVEHVWQRDGRVVDPFRPQVEPGGFDDEAALQADRERHLAATRDVFELSDVLVFTLGLTEGWRSKIDGSVFPTAPGVAGGSYDISCHEFVNFSVEEVRASLFDFCNKVRSVNPRVHIILTVSPVPLVATYEDRHVLVATSYSKSVLRVAAEEARQQFDFVDYFPSYELIALACSGTDYYANDLREVRDTGVRHVMRCFMKHYVDDEPWSDETTTAPQKIDRRDEDVVCDEEVILSAINIAMPSSNSKTDSADLLARNPQDNDAGIVGGHPDFNIGARNGSARWKRAVKRAVRPIQRIRISRTAK